MAELLRRGVLAPSMVYAFLMTKGEQQVAQSTAKARARNRAMTNEGAEQTPDLSPPRPPPERPPLVFARGETLEPKKSEYHGKADRETQRRLLGTLRKNDDFLFYMESVERFFNCAEKFSRALCARMTHTFIF